MRAISSILIGLISINVHAQDPIDPHKQLAIKSLESNELVIDGTQMTKIAMIGAYGISWDPDHTTYLITRNTWGGSSKIRISEEGAAAGDQISFRGWPYLLNRKGRIYAIDDSPVRSSLAKLERYASFSKLWDSKVKGIGAGMLLTLVMLIDQNTSQAIFNPESHWYFPFLTGWGLAYGTEAVLDQFKSHRQLGFGGNFFTKEIARNVIGVKPVRQIGAPEDAPIVDYEIRTRKGKNGIVETVFLSDLVSSTNPKAPKYRSETCEDFMRK